MNLKKIGMIALLVFGFMIPDHLSAGDQFKNLNGLLEKALTEGQVNIMIKMDVPNLQFLTANSTFYRSSRENSHIRQEAFNADLKLKQAISNQANSILYHLKELNFRHVHTFKTIPFLSMAVGKEALLKLTELDIVVDIIEDEKISLPKSDNFHSTEVKPDIPHLSDSTNLIGAPYAWSNGYDGSDWYVAVIDTGARLTHEMFQGKQIVEACFAIGEDWYDRENGDCPNGKITMTGPGSNVPHNSNVHHGTHVAGIAVGNNHNGRYGVARGANLMAIDVFSWFPNEAAVLTWNTDVARGLEYVYTQRNNYQIASVNISSGGSSGYSDYCESDVRKAMIDNLTAVGIAVVVSAGNESLCEQITQPGCIQNSIAIGNTTKDDRVYYGANWDNEMMDLLAPGVYILSAVNGSDTNYGSMTGTSMSAPHVAGAWAIIKQYKADISVAETLELFTGTGNMLTSTSCSGAIPKPRIAVGDAVASLITLSPPRNVSGSQVSNRSLIQTEYMNVLNWEANPLNANKVVTAYQIYEMVNNQPVLVSQVDSNTFRYIHRNQKKNEQKIYQLTAVDDQGKESPASSYTLIFNGN